MAGIGAAITAGIAAGIAAAFVLWACIRAGRD